MSSPAARRSQRNSLSATPRRSRNPDQTTNSLAVTTARNSPPAQQPAGTPRSSRQNVAVPSPLFLRSSPVNETTMANGGQRMDISSPLIQSSIVAGNDNTPRGRPQPPNGMPDIKLLEYLITDVRSRLFANTLCFKFKSDSRCQRQC